MEKFGKYIISGILVINLFVPMVVHAVPSAPPGSSSGQKGSQSSSNISYSASTTFSSSTTESAKTYSSSNASQNALLVSGGTSTITDATITKSGDSSGDDADFYGTNAALLVYNGATLNITGGKFTTNGSHANAIFAYGTGIINVSDATINTTSNNSGGIMVTGGGTLNASNLTISTISDTSHGSKKIYLTVNTKGNSSAAIRSDRGGGTLTVNGGTYETSGVGSPAIYSTADITVNNATLTSTASEGAVVEGANSITLNNTKLIDTNTTLNGNSETYKNIFLYQSMSGDASEGTAKFTAKDSSFTTNKGDTIFVTNTTAIINLENNTITNNDGDFLRIQTGKWGNSGSNGGNVTLNMTNQKISGNIIVDGISTLDLNLSDGSRFEGKLNSDNEAKNISLTLSSDSVLVLTGNSYVTSLTNAITDNSNIYLNGYKLYVNGTEISANNNEASDLEENDTDIASNASEKTEVSNKILIVGSISIVFVIGLIAIIFLKRKTYTKREK